MIQVPVAEHEDHRAQSELLQVTVDCSRMVECNVCIVDESFVDHGVADFR